MAGVPPLRGAQYTTEVSLVSQADTDIFQDNPTLAAGDVLVIKDGVLDGNIDTLPTAIVGATKVLLVTLSAAEMTADRVTALFSDQAGAEWQDLTFVIDTDTAQMNDLAQPGSQMDLVNAPNAVAIAAIQAGLAVPGDAMALTNAAIDAIWQELIAAHAAIAGSVAEALAFAASCGLGADGPVRTYTVTNSITGLPESAVYVRVTTDVAGLNTIRAGYTDVFGNFYPRLIAGTYYFWCTKQGFSEVQADQEVFV